MCRLPASSRAIVAALLGAREAGDLIRIACLLLNQREGLQHRIVQPRGNLRALVRHRLRLPLRDERIGQLGYQRLVVAFQPHTYSRTAKLFDRFVEELKLADVAVLAEIYAAREQNTMGISSADLARNIPGSVYCSTLDKVTAQLRELARPGDLILTVGAGDIYRAGEKLLSETEG